MKKAILATIMLFLASMTYGTAIIVTKPQAGYVWATGSKRLIKWSSSGVSTVDILFSADNGADWQTIAESITDANSYLWEIPDGIDSNQCIISVLPADGDENVCCRQSNLFTIKPYPHRPPVPFRWYGRLPPPDLSNNKGPRFGCVKWVFETAGSVFSQASVTRPDRRGGYKIYAGCETGQIYALNNRGELLWSYDANAPIVGSPGIGYYDMVYVGAGDRLYAFDEDGELRWTRDTDAPIYSQPVAGYDGKIYVSSLDGTLYAIRPDGTCVWTFATKGPGKMRGAIFTSPMINKSKFGRRQRGGDIYIAGFYDPNLYALDAETGNVKWVCNFEFSIDPCDPNRDTQAGMPFATCAVGRDGTIYQTLVYDPNLYAIDSADGTIIWRTNLADPCCGWFDGDFTQRFGNPSGWCEPVIGPDGTIYVSFDDPYLRAVKPDGTIKWVSRLGMVGGFTLSVGVDGLIYAASDDGFVCVVDSRGREVSRFKGNGWVSYPVIAEDGTLIVSDANNILWAISSRGCRAKPPALHIAEDIQPSWNVDFMDLALLANSWLECTDPFNLAPNRSQICGPGIAKYGAYLPGDVDRDQYVDFRDFAAVAEKWLTETHRYYHGR
jgi:outer membrane protein assembly factor BamB